MIVPNGGVVVDFDVAAQIDELTNDFCKTANKSRDAQDFEEAAKLREEFAAIIPA